MRSQCAPVRPGLPSGEVEWIEPVEVWGAFRAARKAQPRDRQSGELSEDSCFTSGSHDGFDHIGASHVRRVELSDACSQQIKLTIVDTLITSRTLEFRQWWHLAPDAPIELIDDVDFDASTAEGIRTTGTRLGSPAVGGGPSVLAYVSAAVSDKVSMYYGLLSLACE